jgi:hypothetical protein
VRPIALSILLLPLLPQPVVHAQEARHCLPQRKPVTLSGRLVRVDEHGYTEWIALRLRQPICALADPTDQFKGAVEGVSVLQTFNADNALVRSQLERLAGRRGALTGELTQWGTGYQRAELAFDVASVQAIDDAGHQALSAPDQPKPVVRDVAAYDVTVRAGRSLTMEARETGSNTPLTPAREYTPHWMTGGEVVYVDCRDGYERKLISSTDRHGFCFDNDLCGFSAYPARTTVVRFHCAKKTK